MRRLWLLIAAIGAGLVMFSALFASVLVWLYPMAYDHPMSWRTPFLVNFCFFAVWVAMAPLVVWLAGRLPLGAGSWRGALPVQLGLGVVLSVVHLAMVEWLMFALGVRRPGDYGALNFFDTLGFSIAVNLQASMAMYWMLAGLAYARLHYRNYQEQSLRASRQETQLARAGLQALESQLEPHFLFNTLNSISALVDHDAAAARAMIARLGDLLRYSLQSRERAEVSFEEELEITERYLEIEQARYAERLRVATQVSPAALSCAVPALLLQPLVENCVRHGVTRSLHPVHLELRGDVAGDRLLLEIRDDGPGADPQTLRIGVGLANVQARLEHLYGGAQSLAIDTAPGRGFAVRIALPARPLPAEEAA
jgi:two-component system LytT family sensor kinase